MPDSAPQYDFTPIADALRRGQQHEGRTELAAALACYEEALTLLRRLPLAHPEVRRLLGVTWMNRGNALQKQQVLRNAAAATAGESSPGRTENTDTPNPAEAIIAYEEAIGFFETLPFDTDPLCLNHLGAAWLNRGHALLAADNYAGAAESFERAIPLLQQLPLEADPSFRLNLAGAWTNLAHATLLASPERSCFGARAAMDIVAAEAKTKLGFAAMSLRARRALVTALGELLQRPGAPGELATEATDAIDDGLALARHWETHGDTQLRPLAARLFRLGAQVYRIHQPHFLAEFVLENLAHPSYAADPVFRTTAEEAITRALAELQRPQLLVAGSPDAEKLLTAARSLRAAQQHLSTLPPSTTSASSA